MTEGWAVPGFTLVRELGSDASGRQVLATDEMTRTQVTIRYLSPALNKDDEFSRRMNRLAQLEDDNLVQVYELVTAKDDPAEAAVVSEYFEGVPLRRLLTDPLDPESAVVVLSDILLGLAAAHGKDITHGDCSPDKVLIAPDGRAKLSDLGIAVPHGKGAPAGDPVYQAPERWQGAPQSPQTDIYAAAGVFVECLTGRRLFPATSIGALNRAHNNAAIPVIDVPGPLRSLVLHGLAKEPGNRPASAAEFLTELDEAVSPVFGADWEKRGRARVRELAQRAATAPAPPPPSKADARTSAAAAPPDLSRDRRPLVFAGAGIAAVVLIGGVAYGLSGSGDDPASGPTVSPSRLAGTASPTEGPATSSPATPAAEEIEGPELARRVSGAITDKGTFTLSFRRVAGKEVTSVNGGAKADSYRVSLAGPKLAKRQAIVLGGEGYLQQGSSWVKLPLGDKAKGYGVLAEQARWGTSADALSALLQDAETLTRNGNRWSGTVPQASGLDAVAPGYRKAKASFELQLGSGWLPKHLKVTITAAGRTKVVTTTGFSKWGGKLTIKSPVKR
ncbi:serine/threonine-protein kinase [Actinocorallia populi]|uniref:serine/threonine-protein kinase n=1 Tax=Actinocorallia populi TaxID=2079200 RepID=UPI0018E50771|nr:serine/threonine-protein kinase [Actinocorallia populi]